MNKNPSSFCFIIPSSLYIINPLSKDIASVIKLLYEIVEIYHAKGKRFC